MNSPNNTTRVLVVDDESDYATSMALLLSKHGYDSQVCLDSRACVEAVKQWQPRVILLDLAMPGISGLEVAQMIRKNTELHPACLIAVTGRGQDLDRVQTKLYGFDHHLTKPLNFPQLDSIMRDWAPMVPAESLKQTFDKKPH